MNITHKKHFFHRLLALCLAITLVITLSDGHTILRSKAADDQSGLAYAVVKNIAQFRNLIDNDYTASVQDIIETDWSGETALYQFTLPADGTLLVAPLCKNGYAKGKLYTNASMTSSLEDAAGCSSSRSEISTYELSAGTYYYKAVRWNGTNPLTVSTFLGFIPKDDANITCTQTEISYDRTDNVTLKTYTANTAKNDLITSINNDETPASTDTIEVDWSGYSDVHSLTVEESGWLLIAPLCEKNYIDWELYSDRALMSCIFSEHTIQNAQTDLYQCYLDAGTYYYRGSRWNGTNALTFTTYLGFIPDAPRLSIASQSLNADASTAQITFQGTSGKIRVTTGEFDPSIISDDKFWNTANQTNMITGNTATLSKNGNYVARLEDADGLYAMVSFTVSGLTEKTILAPTPSPSAASTPKPTLSPTASPKPSATARPTTTSTAVSSKTYKIKVKKKKLTLRVKKKKKITYTVTKGYIGFVRLKTSNPKIATINSKGIVTARKQGKCTITLSLANGKKATVKIIVKK